MSAPSARTRLLRFAGLQAANAIVPLLVLPVVIDVVGEAGWVVLAIGMAVGAAAAVLVGLAWPLTGPPRVAGVDPATARAVYGEGLAMRLLVLAPVLLAAAAAVVLLAPSGASRLLGVLMALATTLNGLTASWYYIGRARPQGIVLFETVPRLLATGAAIPVVGLTAWAPWYPLLLMIAGVAGLLAATREVNGRLALQAGSWAAARAGWRAQTPLALAGVLSTGATALAVPIASVSGTALSQVGRFAAAVRLRSLAQGGIAAGTTALQGWVAEGDLSLWRRRAARAVRFNTALGVLAGGGIAVLAPVLDSIVFGPATVIDPLTAALLGCTCLAYAISSSLSNHILTPAGRTRQVVSSTTIASLLAMPTVFLASRWWGATGAMGAVAGAEALVVVLQAHQGRIALRQTTRLARDAAQIPGEPEPLG